jgi:lipoprotein-anchoring transpeptidase ErfK/SrfK
MPSGRALALAAGMTVLAMSTARPARADSVHIVTPGDNVFRIALRYGTTVGAITRANGLSSPDRIYTGQRLVIPTAGLEKPAASPATGSGAIHIVGAGETLSGIALRYGTTIAALITANGLRSPDLVYIGQRLSIPGTGGGAPAGSAPAAPAAGGLAGRRIVVDLSSQTLVALESDRTVATFQVSSGKASTPTPIGTYRIYARYRSQTMSGPGYYLPGVPYVQYFVSGYAIHGTYWHTNFGTPMSHGCVNLSEPNAAWLWTWSGIGTPVIVQW